MLRSSLQLLRLRPSGIINFMHVESFKNFGHKPEPIPTVTFLWHGFLTFSFIGVGINWKRIGGFIFGEDIEQPISTQE